MVHFPISIDLLKQERTKALPELSKYLESKLETFNTIFLKLSFSKSLDISWYYHILLVGDKESFLNDVLDEKEKILIRQLLDPVVKQESKEILAT